MSSLPDFLNLTRDERIFLYACDNNHSRVCQHLLDKNKKFVDSCGLEGRSGLMLAAREGHLDVVKILVDAGADPRKTDDWGYNALLLAIPGGHSKTVNFLFNRSDLTCDTPLGQVNPITEAATHGRLAIANIILELYSRQFLNAPVPISGMTPLMLAVVSDDAATVKTLIKRHADARVKNSAGMTAWDLASYSTNDTIKDLLGVSLRITPLSPSFFTCQSEHPSELSSPSSSERIESFKHFKHLMVQITDPSRADKNHNVHALTPNVRAPKRPSPSIKVKEKSARRLSWLRVIKIRSRSASPMKLKKTHDETSSDGIFEYILSSADLLGLWDLFKQQEIDLKAFLTLKEEDLDIIGVKTREEKIKIFRLIERYKNVF